MHHCSVNDLKRDDYVLRYYILWEQFQLLQFNPGYILVL
jgi:hypothetical protein